MYVRVDFVRRLLENVNCIISTRRYDYIVKDKEEYYMIFRRWYDGIPWHKFCKIYKKDLGDQYKWKYYEEGKKRLGDPFVF